MAERTTTKHDIQRDELNLNRSNYSAINQVLVTGSIGMQFSGIDPGTGQVLLSVTGTYAIAAGTWTPLVTGTLNTTAVTAALCHYIRVGNEVFFQGSIQINATAAGAFTARMTLPIPSDFTLATDASGNGTNPGTGVPNIISIRENQANNDLQLDGYAQASGNLFYRLAGGYLIK